MNFVCLPRQAYLRCVCAALNFDVGEIWSWRDDENIQKGKKKSYQSVEKELLCFPDVMCISQRVMCISAASLYRSGALRGPEGGQLFNTF